MPIAGPAGPEAKCAIVALLLLGLIISNAGAQEQTTPAPEPPPAASVVPQPPPEAAPPTAGAQPSGRPGLIDKLGDLLRDSAEGVSSGLKGTQQRIEDLNKGTLDTLSNIPIAGFASGRSLCPRSANGAPDCYAATEKLCKEKGYSFGRSLDTESSETCNPRIYLPGYQRKAGDCRIDTFVTRAACQ
jgi:hypothetical protein